MTRKDFIKLLNKGVITHTGFVDSNGDIKTEEDLDVLASQLITQRPCLQIPTHQMPRLQHMNLGRGLKHSVHRNVGRAYVFFIKFIFYMSTSKRKLQIRSFF